MILWFYDDVWIWHQNLDECWECVEDTKSIQEGLCTAPPHYCFCLWGLLVRAWLENGKGWDINDNILKIQRCLQTTHYSKSLFQSFCLKTVWLNLAWISSHTLRIKPNSGTSLCPQVPKKISTSCKAFSDALLTPTPPVWGFNPRTLDQINWYLNTTHILAFLLPGIILGKMTLRTHSRSTTRSPHPSEFSTSFIYHRYDCNLEEWLGRSNGNETGLSFCSVSRCSRDAGGCTVHKLLTS